jgi:hypothetical protein
VFLCKFPEFQLQTLSRWRFQLIEKRKADEALAVQAKAVNDRIAKVEKRFEPHFKTLSARMQTMVAMEEQCKEDMAALQRSRDLWEERLHVSVHIVHC